ncbi:general transcription factor IIa 2, isoform CRA_d [Rattus norvegicus]|uniref:General transcription factor IIa 2, isoform CRA_d n=1 Tax=Rattus norvegicus TaxID=10116 RepID=A6KEU4_RAT|nr:general transcription factor IIa 2, isoform CRA_d [Rattus norvegicus]
MSREIGLFYATFYYFHHFLKRNIEETFFIYSHGAEITTLCYIYLPKGSTERSM